LFSVFLTLDALNLDVFFILYSGMTTDLSAFQNDVEYISFDASPHSSSRAGPSRITQNGVANDRTHDELDSGDERLLAAQNGKRKMNGDGRKKDKEGGKRAKGEAKGDTGPKNLKEERKAAERHAPWADMVDWERCHDPVEM